MQTPDQHPLFTADNKKALINYKGIYHGNVEEKYTCPKTGAHFKFNNMCQMLESIRRERGDPQWS